MKISPILLKSQADGKTSYYKWMFNPAVALITRIKSGLWEGIKTSNVEILGKFIGKKLKEEEKY